MNQSKKIYMLIALLGSAVTLYSSVANVLSLVQAIADADSSGINRKKSAKVLPAGGPIPQAPDQPLAPVTVSITTGLANFGTGQDITLDYQEQQLPITAQIQALNVVGQFGSVSTSQFTIDSATMQVLNSKILSGHSVVMQAGVTTIDQNVVAYLALVDEADISKMFGYAIQEAPAGVTTDGLTGFTITYQLATESTVNTITLSAKQSLGIFNPTVSVLKPIGGVSVQGVFGSSGNILVSDPITFDASTVAAIQAALQAGDTVAFQAQALYQFGMCDISAFAYDMTSKQQIGNAASMPATPQQNDAGSMIAYVVNVTMAGQSGQATYVRGANEILQCAIPNSASSNMQFYVPADLAVGIPDNGAFPNVTINGIFADGSTSAGMAFAPQDITLLSTAIAQGDVVSILVEQASNGSSLTATAYNVSSMKAPIIATAVNTLTSTQETKTLTGYSVTYQMPGQSQPTTLQAQLNQAVTFGTTVYFALPVNPSILGQQGVLDIRGYIAPQPGAAVQNTGSLMLSAANVTNIQQALTAGHAVSVGVGYSPELQKVIVQAYDTIAQKMIAQQSFSSTIASQLPLLGFAVAYQNQNAQGDALDERVMQLVPSGNVMTLVPNTATPPAATVSSNIACVSKELSQLQFQAVFDGTTVSEAVQVPYRQIRELLGLLETPGNFATISTTVANGFCLFSVWNPATGELIIPAQAVPAPAGKFNGFMVEYSSIGSDGTIADLFGQLQAAGATVSNLAFNIPAGESFENINFNVTGSTGYGYAFGASNPWNSSTNIGPNGLSANIQSTLSSISAQQWAQGISFMLVGLDTNNAVIGDITKTMPATFMLYVFDNRGLTLSTTLVPLQNVTFLNSQSTIPQSFSNPTIEAGVTNGSPVGTQALSFNYPMLVTVNVGNSAPVVPTAATAQATMIAENQSISIAAGQTLSMAVVQPVPFANAQQSIKLPLAQTPVSQLWFSPTFAQGFAELPLQNAPWLMTQLNKALSQGDSIVCVHSVLPTIFSSTVQGYDCVVTAYDTTQGNAQLFTYAFPLIQSASKTPQPLLQGNQWNSSNISYQLGTQASQYLNGLPPTNASFSIGS